MATIFRDGNLGLLDGKVAVIGDGSQGHAHALNLRDSGVQVEVGLREGSPSSGEAEAKGLTVRTVADAVAGAQLVSILLPTRSAPGLHGAHRAQSRPGRRGAVRPRLQHPLRAHRTRHRPRRDHGGAEGPRPRRAPFFHRGLRHAGPDRGRAGCSGNARDIALAYAIGIGAGRAGILETTFKEETETDLFGEQAVLCGGITDRPGRVRDLVEAGYQPEIAYYECLHELKLIVDLIYEGGLADALLDLRHGGVRRLHARPARHRHPRARGDAEILADIHPASSPGSGSRTWTTARPGSGRSRRKPTSPDETVGEELRGLMHKAGER